MEALQPGTSFSLNKQIAEPRTEDFKWFFRYQAAEEASIHPLVELPTCSLLRYAVAECVRGSNKNSEPAGPTKSHICLVQPDTSLDNDPVSSREDGAMMGYSSTRLFAALVSLAACGIAAPAHQPKPPFFLLAGDSTTAVQSEGGGGWGDGFLNTTLHHGASGINYGHNGATTVSFREGGDWDQVLRAAEDSLSEYRPYVTIQFGHNDQKAAKNISIDEFTANLERFVEEVRAVPAVPVLVTSLSRVSQLSGPERVQTC